MNPDPSPPAIACIIVAAGRGLRAGGDIPKQYREIGGRSVLARTLSVFLGEAELSQLVVVIGADDADLFAQAIADLPRARLGAAVIGGETRQDSVRAGLQALAAQGFDGTVLVHDAARPFVTGELIRRAIAAVAHAPGAVPALPVTDTIKRTDGQGRVVETPRRETLISVQTPQAFAFAPLLAAHDAAAAGGQHGFTDDAALLEWAGHPVAIFPGDPANVKLTHPQDFAVPPAPSSPLGVRVATGYDVHAFADGDHIWLGGVRIPHERGVLAHSDGDVALHALTDALLGALAEGDIGTHFPPSDPRWKGAASDQFLAFAAERLRRRGGRIDFLDLTIVCEAPRIGPHRDAIRARIAEIAGIRPDQVAIKATTSEAMGFTGRREGLAALATATLRLPETE